MIETERLIIRPWRDGDRAVYLTTCNTEAVTANLGGPAKIEDVDAGLGRIRKSQEDNGFCFWALERKADRAFLGYCGLKVTNLPGTPVADDIEIGWRLREDAWGQGYATEAATAVLDWAWTTLPVDRIVSFTIPTNLASQRVMERIGMRRREDLDFSHPNFPPDHQLSVHVAYAVDRPRA